MNYKLVELNNKSRKGMYVYVKKPKEKGKYYKVRKGTSIKDLITYYETKKSERKIKLKKPRKTRRRTIESTLKKGIKSVNIQTINQQTIHTAKKRLFRNIVKDKDILEILITEQNLQKIKHRFDYKITAKGKEGTLFTAEKLNITPQKAMTEANQISIGEKTKFMQTSPVTQKLKKLGWTIEHGKEGTITNITMTITFRKG